VCHVSKRPRADDGVAVVVGTGVGEQCVDDAGGGVGDGDYDGGLPDLGPVLSWLTIAGSRGVRFADLLVYGL
jgi:hypothetical protein